MNQERAKAKEYVNEHVTTVSKLVSVHWEPFQKPHFTYFKIFRAEKKKFGAFVYLLPHHHFQYGPWLTDAPGYNFPCFLCRENKLGYWRWGAVIVVPETPWDGGRLGESIYISSSFLGSEFLFQLLCDASAHVGLHFLSQLLHSPDTSCIRRGT